MVKNKESIEFGYQTVSPSEKTQMVDGVFSSVASNYDVMNDLMSGGLHRLWKDRFVRLIRPRKHYKYLDVAGGTGDIAFRIRRKTGADTHITICDLCDDMLAVGRDRAIDRGFVQNMDWVSGNAEKLPLPSDTYDVYTIAFGLRNVTHIDDALVDAHRVLKPGGRFFCLEFSHVRNPFFAKAYDLYSENIIPRIGQVVAKDRDSYQYLVESIRKFPNQKALAKRLEEAGFKHVTYSNMTGGVVAIHSGIKL